jgi:hypothetical protein
MKAESEVAKNGPRLLVNPHVPKFVYPALVPFDVSPSRVILLDDATV